MRSILIRDTTREQREQIVRQGLAACGSSCEGCNGCDNLGGGRVETIYQPYIDGEKELFEINAEQGKSCRDAGRIAGAPAQRVEKVFSSRCLSF